jgi:hypothetical protein
MKQFRVRHESQISHKSTTCNTRYTTYREWAARLSNPVYTTTTNKMRKLGIWIFNGRVNCHSNRCITFGIREYLCLLKSLIQDVTKFGRWQCWGRWKGIVWLWLSILSGALSSKLDEHVMYSESKKRSTPLSTDQQMGYDHMYRK